MRGLEARKAPPRRRAPKRTAELAAANNALHAEVAERQRAEEALRPRGARGSQTHTARSGGEAGGAHEQPGTHGPRAAGAALVVVGQTDKEIGAALFIGAGTVRAHLNNVFAELGASDRTQAATLAIKRGIVRLE